jgi:hypothetical protein
MCAVQFLVVECYIPPSDLETLTDDNKAWRACPAAAHPILVGDLNFNFCAPCTEWEETIAKQVDAMVLLICQDISANARGHGSMGGVHGG